MKKADIDITFLNNFLKFGNKACFFIGKFRKVIFYIGLFAQKGYFHITR